MAQPTTIDSIRLELVPLSPPFLEASLAGDRSGAAQLVGFTLPTEWWAARRLMRMRLDALRQEPQLAPWLLRAVVLRRERAMIGHIGFHAGPGAAYLEAYAPGGVELGYTIYPTYRRQGYATEAAAALMEWAYQKEGITRFVVSISPDNQPSIRLAARFGFQKVGSHIDEEDGPEDILLRELPPPPAS